LNFPALASTPSTYNATSRGFTGIEFYAMGTASAPVVIVQTAATEQVLYGGTCTLGTSCTGNQAALPNLSPSQWTLYQVPFGALAGGSATFDPGAIWSIEFQPGVGAYDMMIDNLSFY
jgi:hypothetical protein